MEPILSNFGDGLGFIATAVCAVLIISSIGAVVWAIVVNFSEFSKRSAEVILTLLMFAIVGAVIWTIGFIGNRTAPEARIDSLIKSTVSRAMD